MTSNLGYNWMDRGRIKLIRKILKSVLVWFPDLCLRVEGSAEFYLDYIKFDMFIDSGGDVKGPINIYFNLELSGHD